MRWPMLSVHRCPGTPDKPKPTQKADKDMMHFLRILALSLLSFPLQAEERQFADIIYTPLDGWEGGKEENASKVFFSELPGDLCDICRFYISGSQAHQGSLARFLDSNLTRFEDPGARDRFTEMGSHSDITLAGHPARMQGYRFGRRTIYILIAVNRGERKSLLGFRGNFYDDDELREAGEVFANQVAPFFDSLEFITDADDLLLPTATPGNMSGVWWGWRQRVTPGLDGLIKTTIDHKVLVFYGDGHVYRGAPPTGVSTMDRDKVAATFDKNLGVYTHQGARWINITYLDGRNETLTWDRSEQQWTDGDVHYAQVTPLPDGSLSDFSYTGFTPGSGIDGGAASASSTTFLPDGTFTGESFGSVSATFSGGGITSSNTGNQRGRYNIRDGLLIMTDQTGKTSAELIFETGDGILIGDLFLETE